MAEERRSRLLLDVIDIDYKGIPYGIVDNRKIYVKYGVPGDRVRVKPYIVRRGRRGKEVWGDIEEVVIPSRYRVEPRCIHFGVCGGCRFQNISYTRQLKYKWRLVESSFERYGLEVEIRDIVRSDKLYYYRNRMDYPVGAGEEGPIIGLKMAGRWDVVVQLEECHLMSMESIEILKRVRDFMIDKGIEPYNIINHTGLVRYIVIREGKFTGDRLVNIVTSDAPFPYIEELVDLIGDLASGIIWSINPTITDVSVGKIIRPIHGKDYLEEEIFGLRFHIHPNAFFQTNSYMTTKLVEVVRGYASGGGKLMDLYSGVGLFSYLLEDMYGDVVSVEIDEYATYSANINRERFKSSVVIIESSVEDYLPIYIQAMDNPPETVIVDPPRPGLSSEVKYDLLRMEPKEIIYVSCNPDSMARDIRLLSRKYRIEDPLTPIDMFPHTPHIEVVARLVRKD